MLLYGKFLTWLSFGNSTVIHTQSPAILVFFQILTGEWIPMKGDKIPYFLFRDDGGAQTRFLMSNKV